MDSDQQLEEFQEIIDNFVSENTQLISQLQSLRSKKNLITEEVHKLKSTRDYFEMGMKLFEEFSSKGEEFAQMFPTCPDNQYIDLHRFEDDETVEQDYYAINDKKKQEDHEAEVKVYRAVQSLKGQNIVVLHSFRYTHYQYRMWDLNHPKKCYPNCRGKKALHSDEGESDFVVIGPDYIVLIEVKNTGENHSSFYEKGCQQMDKLIHMIRGVAKESLPEERSTDTADAGRTNSFKVFRFVAFPSYNRSDGTNGSDKLPDRKCLFASDLDAFADWWQQNVLDSSSVDRFGGDLEKVKAVLWTQWATNSQRTFVRSSIGLESDIVRTDKRLRESVITTERRKSYRKNGKVPFPSNVVDVKEKEIKASNVFQIMGIEFITKYQEAAFEKESANLVITGCAGSGKSLMLIARFLNQALTNRELKMLLLVFNQLKLVEYRKIFERAKLNFTDIADREFDPSLWKTTSSGVAVIHCNTQASNTKILDILKELTDVVVYVDDAHACGCDFLSLKCACVVVDFNQCHLASNQIEKPIWENPLWNKFDQVALVHNYRNTWNIVANLTELSKVIKAKDKLQKYFAEYPSELSHDPSHGHLIYGPQTDIDVIHNHSQLPMSRQKQLEQVLQVYIERRPHFFPMIESHEFTMKYFIMDPSEDSFYKQLAQRVNEELDGFCVTVTASEQNIYSAEFAVCFVFVLFLEMDTKMLRSLYNVMSRARTYCHIMVMTDERTKHDQLDEFLSIFKQAKITHITPPNYAYQGSNAISDAPDTADSDQKLD